MIKKRQYRYHVSASRDGWPTRLQDQQLALDLLLRHQAKYGVIKLLESAEIDEATEAFKVSFPEWFFELKDQLTSRHGAAAGEAAFHNTLNWIIEEVGHSVSSQP